MTVGLPMKPDWLTTKSDRRLTVGLHLAVGKDDNNSDQIKFRPSDCVFEYGDFRDEESDDKYEGFLVVAYSKGDTLSLFEPKG
jgi:hypothetical protein